MQQLSRAFRSLLEVLRDRYQFRRTLHAPRCPLFSARSCARPSQRPLDWLPPRTRAASRGGTSSTCEENAVQAGSKLHGRCRIWRYRSPCMDRPCLERQACKRLLATLRQASKPLAIIFTKTARARYTTHRRQNPSDEPRDASAPISCQRYTCEVLRSERRIRRIRFSNAGG